MNIVTFISALIISALLEASSSLGLLFGISVSTALLFTELFSCVSRSSTTLKTQTVTRAILSLCIGFSCSMGLGALFSGEADGAFCSLTGAASAIISFNNGKEDGCTFFCTMIKSTVFVVSAFCVGVLREAFGEGSVFGRDVHLLSEISANALNMTGGGLLAVWAVASALLLVKGRIGRKNGA